MEHMQNVTLPCLRCWQRAGPGQRSWGAQHQAISSAACCRGSPAGFCCHMCCSCKHSTLPARHATSWYVSLYCLCVYCVCLHAGIFVSDILDAVPIDKYFELFKPSAGGEGGFIRLGLDYTTDPKALPRLKGEQHQRHLASCSGLLGSAMAGHSTSTLTAAAWPSHSTACQCLDGRWIAFALEMVLWTTHPVDSALILG